MKRMRELFSVNQKEEWLKPPCIRCPFETWFALPGPFRNRYWLTGASVTSLGRNNMLTTKYQLKFDNHANTYRKACGAHMRGKVLLHWSTRAKLVASCNLPEPNRWILRHPPMDSKIFVITWVLILVIDLQCTKPTHEKKVLTNWNDENNNRSATSPLNWGSTGFTRSTASG